MRECKLYFQNSAMVTILAVVSTSLQYIWNGLMLQNKLAQWFASRHWNQIFIFKTDNLGERLNVNW